MFAFVDIQNALSVVVSFIGSSIRGVLVCHHTLQKPLLILTLMSTITASYRSKKYESEEIYFAKHINAKGYTKWD